VAEHRKINVTDRIPCTPETKVKLRDFANGLGLTYDEALNFMMHEFMQGETAEMLAGFRLREKAQAWKAHAAESAAGRSKHPATQKREAP
jgi:hypothetical protein